jgi:hypothetical protein
MFYFICYSSTNINVLSSIVVVTDPNHSPYNRMEIAECLVGRKEHGSALGWMAGRNLSLGVCLAPRPATGVRTYPYHCFSCGLLARRTHLATSTCSTDWVLGTYWRV